MSAESRGSLWGVTERGEARKPLMRATKREGLFPSYSRSGGWKVRGWWQPFAIKSWLQLDPWGIFMNHLEMEVTFIWYGGRNGVLDWEILAYEIPYVPELWCFMASRHEKLWFIHSILIDMYISSYLHFEKRVSQLNENWVETMIQVWGFPTASLLVFYPFPLK